RFFFQAEDGIRDFHVTGVQTCALPIFWTNIDSWREMNLKNWFFYDDAYAQLGGTFWWAGLVRLAIIIVAVILSAAFFVLVPRSKIGSASCREGAVHVMADVSAGYNSGG